MDTTFDTHAELSNAADDIATFTRERLSRLAYELDNGNLTVEKAVEFLADEGEIEAIADQFPQTLADHLARTEPETLRDALRDQDELHTFDRDDADRILAEVEDYAESVRQLVHERLEDVPSELEAIASAVESLVADLRNTLDV